ncbi:MAG: alanine racemase [Deltaproteobacteria bacterium]|jgi:alanine racemase|nr:alanine racemase [Deltaproteobacteria bacterium]
MQALLPPPQRNTLDYNGCEVDLDALRHNFATLAAFAGERPLMAVVKGDAYGHGLIECATALAEAGASRFGVLDVQEGVLLRESRRFKGEICVLAGVTSELQTATAVRANLSIFAYSPDQLLTIAVAASKETRRIRVYLKIDTGMSRLGVPWNQADDFLAMAAEKSLLDVAGIATHLATLGDAAAFTQLTRFWGVCQRAEELFRRPLENSALSGGGLLAYPDYPDGFSRPGLVLYGAVPALSPGTAPRVALPWVPGSSPPPPPLDDLEKRFPSPSRECAETLKPVMRVTSRVIQVKIIRRSEAVSYGGTFRAERDTRVAVLPFGYVHGLQISRSGRCAALIRGKVARGIGRVCMNLSIYDVDGIPSVQAGDEAVLLGAQDGATLGPQGSEGEDLSPYETLCCLGRLNRRFHSGMRRPGL